MPGADRVEAADPVKISIIIPVLNEQDTLPGLLKCLQSARARGHEVLLVDGGSEDDTLARAQGLVDRVVRSERGRARQMNLGARHASGQVYWFLHADVILPNDALALLAAQAGGNSLFWGRFDVRLTGRAPGLRMVEWMMNLRSRLSGIATGDQGIFVSARLFHAVGGYEQIPIMEDIALSKRLKQLARPVAVRACLLVSSRYWERRGLWRTILLMWWMRFSYFIGISPARLARWYSG